MTLTAERRGEIEREIVTKIIDKALSLNLMISVNNGGDDNEITKSQIKDDILKAMFATDTELMLLHSQGGIALGDLLRIRQRRIRCYRRLLHQRIYGSDRRGRARSRPEV